MQFFQKTIIGIDFNDYYAQLIEISVNKESIILESYNRTVLPAEVVKHGEIINDQQFKEILTNLLNTANPKPITSKNIAIVFPSSKVFTHIFKFPKNLEENEIRKSLQFEAETVIPFAINDVYWDFTILESDDKSKYVLFVSITKSTADKYCEILESIDIAPLIFGIDVEALKFSAINQLKNKDPFLLIDINAFSINYLIIKNDVIKHVFSTSKGAIDLIEGLSKEHLVSVEEILKQKEINKLNKKFEPKISEFLEKHYKIGKKIIVANEKREDIGPISQIVLTGQFLNLTNFYSFAQKYFAEKNISVGDPRYYLSIDTAKFKPFENEKNVGIYSTYFFHAAGIALRALFAKKHEGINLLPDRLKTKIQEKKKTFLIAGMSLLMCAFTLFMATLTFFKFQDLNYKRELFSIKKNQIDQIIFGTRYQEIKGEITNFNNEVNALSLIDSELFSLSKTMEELIKIVPPGITISNIHFSDDELKISITGIANQREDLLKTTQIFKEQKFVQEVITPISNYDQKTNISFVIELLLNFQELPKYAISNS